MNNNELRLYQKKLRAQSAHLRASLCKKSHLIESPLNFLDRTRDTLRWVYKHPVYPAAIISIFILLKPKRTLRWANKLWAGWATYQRVRLWLAPPQS